jgi:Ni/Fe-hydrogenase subunit HybB-like protein
MTKSACIDINFYEVFKTRVWFGGDTPLTVVALCKGRLTLKLVFTATPLHWLHPMCQMDLRNVAMWSWALEDGKSFGHNWV